MNVEPTGLPAALKAWRQREPEPVLTIRCSADARCDTEVGAVYRSPQGLVVESRTSAPQQRQRTPSAALDLGDLAEDLGVAGMLAEFDSTSAAEGAVEENVQAQIDLLRSEFYWHDPRPVCPSHGRLRLDQAALADAVRQRAATYEARPG